MKHSEIFSDGKEREECLVAHSNGHSCIRCKYCGWVEWPYDSECKGAPKKDGK
jgi:hypothetical protein